MTTPVRTGHRSHVRVDNHSSSSSSLHSSPSHRILGVLWGFAGKDAISLAVTVLLHGTTMSIALLGLTVNPISSVVCLSAIPTDPVYESISAIFSVLLCICVHFTHSGIWRTKKKKKRKETHWPAIYPRTLF